MAVYFIQAGPNGPIKVGFAENVQARLSKIRADNPAECALIGLIEGDEEAEQSLHRQLSAHRLRGEWFAPHPAVLAAAAKGADAAQRYRVGMRNPRCPAGTAALRACRGWALPPQVARPLSARRAVVDRRRFEAASLRRRAADLRGAGSVSAADACEKMAARAEAEGRAAYVRLRLAAAQARESAFGAAGAA